MNTPIHSPVSNSKRSIWWYASWGRPAKPLSGQRLAPNVVGGTVLVQLFSSHQAWLDPFSVKGDKIPLSLPVSGRQCVSVPAGDS